MGTERGVDVTIRALLTVQRDKRSAKEQFRWAERALMPLLMAEVYGRLPHVTNPVETPVGVATGTYIAPGVMVVQVLRSGQGFVEPAIALIPSATIGTIWAKRHEQNGVCTCQIFNENFPMPLQPFVIICDPMLATGSTAVAVVQRLKDLGYATECIYFVGVIAAPEGMKALGAVIPEDHIVVGAVDERLNESAFIVPGLGDYGDRKFE